jgi:hypothetical protein
MRVMLAMLLVALLASGCGSACACSPTPTPPATPLGALSKDAAIAAALAVAPPSTTEVAALRAKAGFNPFADSATGPMVWLVFLKGNFALPECPPDSEYPNPSPPHLPSCIWKDGGLTAVLDVFTGQLIGWQAS